MRFRYHILFGSIASIAITYLFELTPLEGGIIFAASILIDVDHYVWYAVRFRNLNPLQGIRWYVRTRPRITDMRPEKRNAYEKGVYMFHDWRAWAALFILGLLVHYYFFLILIGFAIHILPDLLELKKLQGDVKNKISCIHAWKQNKGKRPITEL